MTPLVSVLTTAYNAERTLEETVRSVMNQSLQDWELVLLDNASTDSTSAMAERLAKEDSRIHFHRNPQNLGITRSALRGLSLCQGQYIARLDADDLCHPERLAKQVAFLQANPDVKLLGTWVERVSETGAFIDRLKQGPASREEYWQIKRSNEPIWLIHSSLMADRETFLHYAYREDDFPCDDSFFWNRVALDHPVLALPEYLTTYRVSLSGAHTTYSKQIVFQGVRLEHCIENGRDIDSKTFAAMVKRDPRWRWRLWRTYAQKHSLRMAGLSYYKGDRLKAALYALASAAVNPKFTVKRALTEARKISFRRA